MKLFVVVALVSACSAARLDRTYLPPIGARNSGGGDGSLQVPNAPPHYNKQSQPQNQYGQPTNFNQHTAYSSASNAPNAYLPPFEQDQGQRSSHAHSVAQQYRPSQVNRQQQYQPGFSRDEAVQFDTTNDESFPNSQQFGFQGQQGQQGQYGQQGLQGQQGQYGQQGLQGQQGQQGQYGQQGLQGEYGQQRLQGNHGQTTFGSSAARFGGQPQYNNPSEFGGQRKPPSFSSETGYQY